jgi:hypothetical protein
VLGTPYRDPGDTPKNRSIAYESGGPEDYEIELQPRILPGEPVKLPEGTVIDLDGSKIPDAWRPSATGLAGGTGNALYSGYIDIVYSPRGNLVGESASGGLIHFYVCDGEDSRALKEQYVASLNPDPATGMQIFNQQLRVRLNKLPLRFVPVNTIKASADFNWISPLDPNNEGYNVRDRRIVTVFTQTGAVSIHEVNELLDADADGLSDDPYYYAELGEGAK